MRGSFLQDTSVDTVWAFFVYGGGTEAMKEDLFSRSFINLLHGNCDVDEEVETLFIEDILRKQSGTIDLKGGFEPHVSNAFSKTVSILLADIYHSLLPELHECLCKNESPIEQLFFLSRISLAKYSGIHVVRRLKKSNSLIDIIPSYKKAPPLLIITSQANIGNYRVDFLLEYTEDIPDMNRKVKASNGMMIPDIKEATAKLIVECDGHDFHEKTKQQAKKDKERDRILQSVGFNVFRFTGSEIYNDCFRCAEQCLDFLEKKVWKN